MRRLGFLILMPALAMLPMWAAGRLLVTMTAAPPVAEASALRDAVQGARKRHIQAYAAVDMATADAAAGAALTAYYRVVATNTGFLHYDRVERQLFDAHGQMLVACARAKTRMERARDSASGQILKGRNEVKAAEDSLRTAPIGPAVRANLARARVAMGTAEARWRGGDFAEAGRLAGFATVTSSEILRKANAFLQNYTMSNAAQRWSRWIADTIVLSRRTGDYAVVVDKLHHKCLLYRGGDLVKTYDADLGGPLWDKMRSGDRATPEGMYRIVKKRPRGDTIYHKALLINYPNDEDRVQFAAAKQKGWISRRAGIGGLIEIHGEGGRKEDWTLGCVALANRDIDELFQLVNVGTPVTIVGTIAKTGSISG